MTLPSKREIVAQAVGAWEAEVVARYVADPTMTVKALAAELGLNRETVKRLLDRHRIPIRRFRQDRNGNVAAMISLLEDGETLQQVGDRFGISRERVRQLVVRDGYVERPAKALAAEGRRLADEAERREVTRERREMLRRIHREKRERLIGVVRDLAKEMKQSPPYEVVTERAGVTMPSMARLFVGRGFRDPHYGRRGMARLYRLAGTTVRPLGGPGHMGA